MSSTNRDDPAEQLAAALGRVVSNTRPEKVAAYAYLQAALAQCALQALIDLMMQKNIFSKAEIDRALDRAHNERFKQLSGSSGAIQMPTPKTRPS